MSQRILVIDQSRTIQVLLSTSFGNAGHQVITCNTPQEALVLLAGLHDAPESIFLALDCKQKAYKVIEYAKKHEASASTRFIVLVVPEEKTSVQKALNASNVSFLVKPFQIEDALALASSPVPGGTASSGIQREREKRTTEEERS